jgi:hypothetical protein
VCVPPAPIALMTSPILSDERGAFSPAGNEVVVTHFTPGTTDGRIYRKLLDSSPATQLVPGTPAGPQADPDWSPRGDWVAFDQDTPSGDTHLWAYNTQGGGLVQLTNSTRYEVFPAFSPNGQEIAYMHGIAYGSTTWELRRVKLDGTGNTLVYACNYAFSWPRWSPDGTRIYFVRGDSLYAVNASGGQPVFVPKVKPSFVAFDLPLGTGPVLTNDTGLMCAGTHLALQDTIAQTRIYPFEQGGKPITYGRWASDGIRALYGVQTGTDVDLYVGTSSCNHAPVLSAASKVDVSDLTLCTQYQRTLSATDSDGDPITYQAAYLPPGATFTGGNRFRWTPGEDQALSTYYVVFRALDNKGGVGNVVVKMTTSDVCEIQCPHPPNCYPASRQPVEDEGLPTVFALRQNSPNPFDETTQIGFDLPEASHVTLGIFDIQGRLVRQLADRPYQAGRWSATWDRRDASGSRVPLGVYFYRARLGSFVSEKKMMLLR